MLGEGEEWCPEATCGGEMCCGYLSALSAPPHFGVVTKKKKKRRWGQCTEEQKKKQKRWKTVTSAEHVDAAADANKWADQRRSSGFTVRNGRKHFFPLSSAAFSSSVAQAAWQSIAMRSGPQLTRNSAKTTLCFFFASQSAGMPVKILMWPADSVYLELPQRARCQRASAHARPPLYISWPTRLRKSETSGSKNCRRVGDGTSAAGFPSRLR